MTVLHTREEFRQFIEQRAMPLFPKHEAITVQLDELDDNANRQLEKELNRLHAVCGCAEGSITSVVGLMLFAVYLVLLDGASTLTGTQALAGTISTFVIFSLGGKFTAIYVAHRKLKQLAGRVI